MAYVLITGASSGIGREFAKKFASKGFDLLLVARGIFKLERLKEELQKEYGVEIKYFSCDLSENNGPKRVYRFVKDNGLDVSVLINNAGFGSFGKFLEGDLARYQNMIDLNNKALMTMTYLFIKDMKERGYGHIVNVASIAGFMPRPYMAVYYASKAFVLNFSVALEEELREDNIKVTTVCPGPVRTDFWDRAGVKMSDFKDRFLTRSPSETVSTAYKAIENNKGLIVDGFFNKAVVGSVKLLAKEATAKVVGFVQKNLQK